MNNLVTLPEDIQRVIFSYAFKCKKEQNLYINKELYELISKQLDGCSEIICLGKPICERCDNIAIQWLRYMGCALF